MANQLTSLSSKVEQFPLLLQPSQFTPIPVGPPHPTLLPHPHFPQVRVDALAYNDDQLKNIKEIVKNAMIK